MLELFVENDKGIPVISTELKTIACFKKLIERDKGSKGDHDGRNKLFATLEAAYIYWEGKFGSPYIQEFPDFDVRLKQIRKEIELPEDWIPDKLVMECLEWFKDSQRTKSMKLVENVEKVIDSMTEYFSSLDLTETIKQGKSAGELKHNILHIQKSIKDLPDTVASVKAMKDIVREEITQKTTGKAGREVGLFEKKPK